MLEESLVRRMHESLLRTRKRRRLGQALEQGPKPGPDGAREGGGRIDEDEPVHEVGPLLRDRQRQHRPQGLACFRWKKIR